MLLQKPPELGDLNHGNQFSDIGTLRWLSLSKPPFSLAFFHGRSDASTSSATTGSTTALQQA